MKPYLKSAKEHLKLGCTLIFLLVNGLLYAQLPAIQWQKSLGGSGDEEAYAVQPTSDGGYIVAGYSASKNVNVNGKSTASGNRGGDDYWVVKLDVTGTTIWQKTFGGTGDDDAYAIRQTSDGGYIVVGTSNSTKVTSSNLASGNHGGNDYWVVKLDGVGSLTWQKSFGGSKDDQAHAVWQTTDGSYIITGISGSTNGNVTGYHGGNYDNWVIKIDGSGNLIWQKSLGGTGDDLGNAIQETSDKGIIVAGYSSSNDNDVSGGHGGNDYWLVKLNSSGNLLWQKTLGGTGDDEAQSVQQTSDGGYVVAGYSSSNDGNISGNHGGYYDYWVVKLDGSGNLIWQKTLGGTGLDQANSVLQAADGGYVVAGVSDSQDGDIVSPHGGQDYWLAKLDGSGALVSQRSLGGSQNEVALYVSQTLDGSYIIAGFSDSNDGNLTINYGPSDYWVVKLETAYALPITFGNIKVVLQNGQSLISWTTQTEINNKGFAVQRSVDGNFNWQTLGFVNTKAANGNSSKSIEYTYTDASPTNNVN